MVRQGSSSLFLLLQNLAKQKAVRSGWFHMHRRTELDVGMSTQMNVPPAM